MTRLERDCRLRRFGIDLLVCAMMIWAGSANLLSAQQREEKAKKQAAGESKTAALPEVKTDINMHLKNIREFVEKQEAVAKEKGWYYTVPSERELARKLTRVRSPMIVFQGWSGSASPGSAINYNVGVYNPDPNASIWLYAHVFVAPANIVADEGAALATVDARFPRLTMPAFPGLTLDSLGSETLQFTVRVPDDVDPSNYLGNTVLMQIDYHDIGQYLDRSVFPFGVH